MNCGSRIILRDYVALTNLGVNYFTMGQFERAAAVTREALRLEPASIVGYNNLGVAYFSMNRLDEAKSTFDEALAQNSTAPTWGNPFITSTSCAKTRPGMQQQFAWAVGKPGAEDILLSAESDTQADYGRLQKARQLSAQAEDSAKRNDSKETAAFWQGNEAIREAELPNAAEGLKQAREARALAPGRDVKVEAAVALARAGDVAAAEKLVAVLDQEFPSTRSCRIIRLPTVRAAIALQRHDPAQAIALLHSSIPYELADPPPFSAGTMYPVRLRGQAYLALARVPRANSENAQSAAAEFQNILDHPGVIVNFPLSALSHLGLARAHALSGNVVARAPPTRIFLPSGKMPIPPPDSEASQGGICRAAVTGKSGIVVLVSPVALPWSCPRGSPTSSFPHP